MRPHEDFGTGPERIARGLAERLTADSSHIAADHDILRQVWALHRPAADEYDERPFCLECSGTWPCDTRLILAGQR